MLLEFLAHILKAISYNMKQMNKQQIWAGHNKKYLFWASKCLKLWPMMLIYLYSQVKQWESFTSTFLSPDSPYQKTYIQNIQNVYKNYTKH